MLWFFALLTLALIVFFTQGLWREGGSDIERSAPKPIPPVRPLDPATDEPDHFQAALLSLLSEAMGGALFAFCNGRGDEMQRDPRAFAEALSKAVTASDWCFGAYDEQVQAPKQVEWQARKDWLKQAAPKEVLSQVPTTRLRQLLAGRIKARSHELLVDRMTSALAEAELEEIVRALRSELLAELDGECVQDYRDRCHAFVRLWHALGCRARNVASFRESSRVIPGMMAAILPSGRSWGEPCECEQLQGGSFPVDSPVLMQYAPCSRLDCGCCWRPVLPARH